MNCFLRVSMLLAAIFLSLGSLSGQFPSLGTTNGVDYVTNSGDDEIATINKPTGTLEDDLLVFVIHLEKGNQISSTNLPGGPGGGWTRILISNQGSDYGMQSFYKVAGSSEPASYGFNQGTSGKWAGSIVRITGVNTVSPINIFGGSTGSSGNAISPSVTTTTANTLVLSYHGRKNGTNLSATGKQFQVNFSSDVSHMLATFEHANASATSTLTATGSTSSFWAAQQIAIASVSADPCATFTLAEGDVIEPQCFGGVDGFISVVVTGGTPGYVFSWEDLPQLDDSTRTGLESGSYKVYVEDDAGCIDSLTILLGEPSQVIITLEELNDETCPDAADGSIEVSAIGGTGTIAFEWSNNETDDQIENLTAGFYSVTATDENGCEATETYEIITENQNPQVDCPNDFDVCANDAQFALTGGTPSGGTYSGTGVVSGTDFNPDQANTGANLITYTYTELLTGCTNTCTFTITVNTNPIANAGSNSPVCEGQTINLTATGGVSYSWEGPDNFTSNLQNPSIPNAQQVNYGQYTVTVTNADACTATNSVTVSEQTQNCCPGEGTTLYASPNGTGDGLSPLDPMSFEDAAEMSVNCPTDIVAIELEAGLYEIDEPCGYEIAASIIGAPNGGSILDGLGQSRVLYIINQDITLSNLIIRNGNAGFCQSDLNGGGIRTGSSGAESENNLVIVNTSFQNNHSPSGSGGHIYNAGNSVTTVTIHNSSFSGGSSATSGGAITNIAEDDDAVANLNLINCQFLDNETEQFGGAIFNNTTGTNSEANVYMVNNLLAGNAADVSGGALAQIAVGSVSTVAAELINCTVADNDASTSGGAFYNENQSGTSATLQVTNTIVWDNTAPVGPLLRTNGTGASNSFVFSLLQSANCADAAVSNVSAVVNCDASNIFNENPQFRNPGAGDYSLILTSPAINAGDNDAINATGVSTDLAGLPRILEGIVDIGAFENISAIPTLSEWGLIILALLMLQGIWLTWMFKPQNVLYQVPALWLQGLKAGIQDKKLLFPIIGITVIAFFFMTVFGVSQAADLAGIPALMLTIMPAVYWYRQLRASSKMAIA